MSTAENTFAALSTGIPYTREQMSKAIYDALCGYQSHEYATGETQEETLEISWHAGREQWQFVRMEAGVRSIHYKGMWEGSLVGEDPDLLYSMCENLDLIDELQDELEDPRDLQYKFQNMLQHYNPDQFELCWQEFERRNPGNPFPKDYAQHLWNQEWFGDLEDQE